MSSTPNDAARPAPISGSWEDLLLQAKRLASNHNDAVIPAYQKIIDRLSSLPPERRMAGNRRLQKVLDEALIGLHVYYTMRGRYDEALAAMPQAVEMLESEEERALWARRETDLLVVKGDVDAATAQMRARATDSDSGLSELGSVALAYAHAGRTADANASMEELEARRAELAADTERTEEQLRSDRALVAWVRALGELQMGNAEQAVAYADEALAVSDAHRDDLQLIYMGLIRSGRDELALRFIQQDQAHPIRSGFWHGLALRHLGREQEAEQRWRTVTRTEPSESQDRSLFEYVMSYYALADPGNDGISLVLSILNRQENVSWTILFLAGLGWALHGNMKNCRNNMTLARAHLRSLAYSHQLPAETWYLCQEFLEPEKQAQLTEFFDVEAPAAAPVEADPLDQPAA